MRHAPIAVTSSRRTVVSPRSSRSQAAQLCGTDRAVAHHVVGGRQHCALDGPEPVMRLANRARRAGRRRVTPSLGRDAPVLRPLVIAGGEPADPHDHQFAQPRVEGAVPEHGGEQVVDGARQRRMVQQHLEDAELGHVVGHSRFVRGGLGLVDRQQGHSGWLLGRGHGGHSVYWRDTCAFTGHGSQQLQGGRRTCASRQLIGRITPHRPTPSESRAKSQESQDETLDAGDRRRPRPQSAQQASDTAWHRVSGPTLRYPATPVSTCNDKKLFIFTRGSVMRPNMARLGICDATFRRIYFSGCLNLSRG